MIFVQAKGQTWQGFISEWNRRANFSSQAAGQVHAAMEMKESAPL